MPPAPRMHRAILAILALVFVAAVPPAPGGRWSGVTDMAHGKLPLVFELSEDANGWSGRGVLGASDLDAGSFPLEEIVVRGDSIGFAFDLRSQMGEARIGVRGAVDGADADGVVTMAVQGVVVDQGTWAAQRVDGS